MICPECHKETTQGKFCGHCGNMLPVSNDMDGVSLSSMQDEKKETDHKENELEQKTFGNPNDSNSKQIPDTGKYFSQGYLNHCKKVIRNPYDVSKNAGSEFMVNGLLNMAVFSLLTPLILYFCLKNIMEYFVNLYSYYESTVPIELPVDTLVIQPFFGLFILMVLIAVCSYFCIRFSCKTITLQEVLSHYGSLLIPFTVIAFAGLLFAFISNTIAIVLLGVCLIGALYLIPPLLIVSYQDKAAEGSMDPAYASLLTYLFTWIFIYFMTKLFFQGIVTEIIENMHLF